jgi:KaiC/GvpD/RAD55 family RecA-like ATPase
LKNEDENGDHVRNLLIVKSRGMGHSNQLWNFLITDKGIQLINSKNKNHAGENMSASTSINKIEKTKT